MKCKKGFKQKGNKCVKKSSPKSYSKKKKFNNPFKMWGSYTGVVTAFILAILSIPQTILGKIGFNQILVIRFVDSWHYVWRNSMSANVGMPIVLIMGFLIGWGIHSLIRRYKK